MLDHVDIRVADLEASQRFDDTVLAVLGKERTVELEIVDWGDFAIVADGRPVAKRLHIAFYAPPRELVDAFHRAGVEAGYSDDGSPGPRPLYRSDYYGGFLLDPDGNSVEAVFTNRERATGAIDHVWLRTRDVAAIRRLYLATGRDRRGLHRQRRARRARRLPRRLLRGIRARPRRPRRRGRQPQPGRGRLSARRRFARVPAARPIGGRA